MKKFHFAFLLLISALLNANFATANDYEEGIAAYKNGNYQVAERYFSEAVRVCPNNAKIRYYLAITLVNLGKIKSGESEYKKVIELAPYSEAAEKAKKGLNLIANAKNPNSINHPTAMASVLQPSENKVVIPITKNHNAIIVSNVLLNDKMNVNFIFDTGATYTSISKQTAQMLGVDLSKSSRVTIKTANGLITVPKVNLKSININGMIINNVEATVNNTPAAENITGLLGLSFLDNFLVTIDKKNGKIILEKI